MEEKICPLCGKAMGLFDHDDEDGNFVRWGWQCDCGHAENDDE